MNTWKTASVICLSTTLLMGCNLDISDSDDSTTEFTEIGFTIASEGTQSDIMGGQILEAKYSHHFNDILLNIPSYSGSVPSPNFEINEVVVLLSTSDACSSLEISGVSENDDTRLMTVTEVFAFDPALCDPSPEALGKLDYAMVEFERTAKPVSVIYKVRRNY